MQNISYRNGFKLITGDWFKSIKFLIIYSTDNWFNAEHFKQKQQQKKKKQKKEITNKQKNKIPWKEWRKNGATENLDATLSDEMNQMKWKDNSAAEMTLNDQRERQQKCNADAGMNG